MIPHFSMLVQPTSDFRRFCWFGPSLGDVGVPGFHSPGKTTGLGSLWRYQAWQRDFQMRTWRIWSKEKWIRFCWKAWNDDPFNQQNLMPLINRIFKNFRNSECLQASAAVVHSKSMQRDGSNPSGWEPCLWVSPSLGYTKFRRWRGIGLVVFSFFSSFWLFSFNMEFYASPSKGLPGNIRRLP